MSHPGDLIRRLRRIRRQRNEATARTLTSAGCDWVWDKPAHVHHACNLSCLHPGSHTCECGETYR